MSLRSLCRGGVLLAPILAAAWLLSSMPGVARSPSNPAKQSDISTENIDAYCVPIEKATKGKPPDRIFSNIGSAEKGTNKWREYSSKQDLEKAAAEGAFDDSAFVWLSSGRILAVNFALGVGSGDWMNYVDFCFWDNGRAARIQSELRTFHGGMIVRRSWWYSPNGHLVKKTERFTDLKTDTPMTPSDTFLDVETPLYTSVRRLPFNSLLQAKHHT